MRVIVTAICTLLLITSQASLANNSAQTVGANTFTKQQAQACIRLNKDLNLASEQMLDTENNKQHLKSKILYLEESIQKRRVLIEELDQTPSHENNDNYNKLVTQFEDLVEERKTTIALYNEEQQRHQSQNDSVIRLEQRFSNQCLKNINITKTLYNDACKLEDVRWCNALEP